MPHRTVGAIFSQLPIPLWTLLGPWSEHWFQKVLGIMNTWVVCISICLCVSLCMCLYVCLYVSLWVLVCLWLAMHVYMCLCVHLYVSAYVFPCVCLCHCGWCICLCDCVSENVFVCVCLCPCMAEKPGGLQSMGSLESDTIAWLHFHFSLSCIWERNGNPLQCSCLENPRDGEAWWATVYGVAQSQTRLKWLSSSSSSSSSSSLCPCTVAGASLGLTLRGRGYRSMCTLQ